MHQLGSTNHFAAERFAYALMAEANAENRTATGEVANDIGRNARTFRAPRSGGDQDGVGVQRFDFGDGYRIVADHDRLGADFAQILHQDVYERIEVVYDQHPLTHRHEGSGPRGLMTVHFDSGIPDSAIPTLSWSCGSPRQNKARPDNSQGNDSRCEQ